MGWLSSLGSTIGGWLGVSVSSSSSSHKSYSSSTQTVYEPDKVKVAELENARMERAIEAQKEIIQMNQEMQLAIIQANAKGFEQTTNILKDMMYALNQIAQERLVLIEGSHFEIVEKIEKLYLSLEQEIQSDNDNFNVKKLPQMLEMLNQFDPKSPSAKLYEKSIDKQIELNALFFTEKLSALYERQKIMVASAIKSKEEVLTQTQQIVQDRMQFLDRQLEQQKQMAINAPTAHSALPTTSNDQIEDNPNHTEIITKE